MKKGGEVQLVKKIIGVLCSFGAITEPISWYEYYGVISLFYDRKCKEEGDELTEQKESMFRPHFFATLNVIISNEMKDETELMNTKIIQSNCSSKKEIKVSFMTSLDYNMCAHVYFLLLSYSVMDNSAQCIYIYPPLAFVHYIKKLLRFETNYR